MGDDSERAPFNSLINVTATFPAVAAIAVGTTYACGAIIRAGQLRNVGLPASEALSLYSPQDLLAQGVERSLAIAFRVGVPLALLVILFVVVPGLSPDRQPEPSVLLPSGAARLQPSRMTPAAFRSRVRRYWLLVWGIALLVVLVSLFPASGPILAAGFLFGFFCATRMNRTPVARVRRRWLYAAFAGIVTAAAVGTIAQAYFYPPQFPDVVISISHRPPIAGKLIAQENASYYVASGHRITIVPQRAVTDASINTRHWYHGPTAVHWLRQHWLDRLSILP